MKIPWQIHAEIAEKAKSGEFTPADVSAAYARYERVVRGTANWRPYVPPGGREQDDPEQDESG